MLIAYHHTADVAGEIVKIFVDNAQPAKCNQPITTTRKFRRGHRGQCDPAA